MNKTAVITGAGSGVGQAVAIKLAGAGWKIALIGRRKETLEETARLAKPNSTGDCLIYPCDIGDQKAVAKIAAEILQKFGEVTALINAAGTNAPRRSLEVLSLEDYHSMLNTNLNGAYYCIQGFLPSMRQRRAGNIVNIVSDAAKAASPKAGPAYVMSKFGLLGLTQSINAEERGNGIRACAILPGDIDTPLLEKRPNPPDAEARKKMLHSEDVAECVWLALTLPERAVIEELILRPR